MKIIFIRLLIVLQIFSNVYADVLLAPTIVAPNIIGGTTSASTTGNAATATALAATPATCGAGSYATGISANGSAVGCTAAAGGGTVVSVSGVDSNGFGFSIANPTTTPTITLTATASGVLKSNGTSITAATANTDYLDTNATPANQKMSGGLNLDSYLTDVGAAGWISGGTVADAGGQTATIATGNAAFRTAATANSPLKYLAFASLGATAIPNNTTRYALANYNAGSPITQFSATDTSDTFTILYLGEVHNVSGVLSVHNDHRPVGDAINRLETAWSSLIGTKVVSGEVTSDPAAPSRKIAVTSGSLIDRFLRPITTAAFDSNVAGTFSTVRRDGAGSWIYTLAQSSVDNSHYDANSSVIGTATGGNYFNQWVIRGINGDIAVQYGQAQYATQVSAVAETAPLTRPEEYMEHGFYVAQLTYLSGGTAPSVITSIKPTLGGTVTTIGTSVHNDLSGLQGGTAAQYYHQTSAEYTGTGTGVPVRTSSPTIVTPAVTWAEVNLGATRSLSASEVSSTVVNNYSQTTTAVYTLPTAAAGYNFLFNVASGVAATAKFAPATGEKFYFDAAAALTAGSGVISANPLTVGDSIAFSTFRIGAAAWAWLVKTVRGTAWTAN